MGEQFARKLGSSNRFITLTRWDGEIRVDVREWCVEPKVYPTKKGISLSLARWKLLCLSFEDIDLCVKENKPFQGHLGGNVFVNVSKDFPMRVDIRQFFIPPGESVPKPTRRGISLFVTEWRDLISCSRDLENKIPEMADAQPCLMMDDHQNQEGMLRCKECNPGGYQEW